MIEWGYSPFTAMNAWDYDPFPSMYGCGYAPFPFTNSWYHSSFPMNAWDYWPFSATTVSTHPFKLYLINCDIDTDVDDDNIKECRNWEEFRSEVTAYSGANFQATLDKWGELEKLSELSTVFDSSEGIPGVFTFGQSVKGAHPCCIAIYGSEEQKPIAGYTHRPDLVRRQMTKDSVRRLKEFWVGQFSGGVHRTELVLVLGEPAGLEQELRNDVSSACDLLEQNSSQNSFGGSNLINASEFKTKLLASLEKHSKNESTDFGAYYIEDHLKRITLAICPTFKELRLFLRHISATTRSNDLRIVYCGHGTESGEIMLFEDNEKPEGLVSGGELREIFNGLYWSAAPQLSMWFNCCYGLYVVARMLKPKILPEETIPTLKQNLSNFVFAAEGDTSEVALIDEFEKWRVEELSDNDFRLMIEINKRLWMAGRTKLTNQSPYSIPIMPPLNLHLIPLSIGVLHGAGEIGIVFANPERSPAEAEAAGNRKIWRLRLRNFEKYPAKCEALFSRDAPDVSCENTSVDWPTIQAMQAHCGDSSVIRFRSWAFLIDGGFISTAPCYWKSIQNLAHLDMVILTHGDCDHVNGLKPFFQWRLNYKNRLSHRKPNPEVRKLVIQRGVLRLRWWNHAIDLANVAQGTLTDEEIADENNIVTTEEQELFKETDDPYGVTVRVILPSSDLAKNANMKLLAERYAEDLESASKDITDATIKPRVDSIVEKLKSAKDTEDLAELRLHGQDIAKIGFNSEELLNVPDSARDILKKLVNIEGAIIRGTTLINRTGIVLLFKFSTNGSSKLALFTGDADASDIDKELQKLGVIARSPDRKIHIHYVDVPHHGANLEQNHAHFLFDAEKYKFDHIVVSTNGKPKNNLAPAIDTLKKLANYMEIEKSVKLYFTYDDALKTDEKKNLFKDIDAKRIQYGPKGTDSFVKIMLEDS